MNGSAARLDTAFTKNRTEELDLDVWEHFVVPPFFDRLDLQEAMKPRVLIGGRGTGKTMLLRYLSHYTVFSRRRPSIPHEAVSHIGLYLRADTQFAKVMTGRGVENDVWEAAFHHLLSLLLGAEILRSIFSIAESRCSVLSPQHLESLHFDRLSIFDPSFSTNARRLLSILEEKEWEFEMWVSNVRKRREPDFLPGRRFLLAVIEQVKQHIPALGSAVFRVYLDEYENLALYQQRIVNTYLKHSEAPLIFNLAMKHNAFTIRETVGNESITEISDYREIDLEEYLADDFEAFAAEILFMNLSAAVTHVPIDVPALRDPASLTARREDAYRERVISAAKALFPGLSQEELAAEVFRDKPVANKLRKEIEHALEERNSDLSPNIFFRKDFPAASVITPALLRRKTLTPTEIADEIAALVEGQDNRFTGKTNWIHNNFVGCLLQLYEPHSRIAQFYAGFTTFCRMARRNVRHLLELCHRSLAGYSAEQQFADLRVSPREQAEAAREASAALLAEIRSFGRFGNRLYTFVLRLGSLFALAHRRPTQSEPEINHFSVSRGHVNIRDEEAQLLAEAIKWSVLFEEKETKVKNEYQPAENEYVLNPIYAPYFNISYRKRRRLDLSAEDLLTLMKGSYADVRELLRRYAREWAVDLTEADPTLFSHLLEG